MLPVKPVAPMLPGMENASNFGRQSITELEKSREGCCLSRSGAANNDEMPRTAKAQKWRPVCFIDCKKL